MGDRFGIRFVPDPSMHPYRHLPDAAFWSRILARPPMAEVVPLRGFPFRIAPRDGWRLPAAALPSTAPGIWRRAVIAIT